MTTRVGIGESHHADPFTAGREAVKSAWQQLSTSPTALCILFVSSRYNAAHALILAGAKSLIGETPLIGCTTSGEITPSGPQRRSVVALLFKRSDTMTTAIGFSTGLDRNTRQSGHELARVARTAYDQAKGSPSRQLFLILSDGLHGNGTDLLRGIQEILGTAFPIVGGSAGDDFMFAQTYQFHNDRVLTDGSVGALFGGEISIGIGTRHGWRPLGKPRVVTGVRAHAITTIDHQPAIKLYESYFGSDAQDLTLDRLDKLATLYPLGVSIDNGTDGSYLVRSALRALDDGSLQCNAEVAPGSEVRLMMATRDTVIEAAREAARQALEQLRGTKAFCAIILESAWRQQLLGRQTVDEFHAVQEVIGPDTPLVGFYTYGEQAPLRFDPLHGSTHFHNEAIVVLMLGEP